MPTLREGGLWQLPSWYVTVTVPLNTCCADFVQLGHRLDENTHVPDHEHLPLYGPSFTLEVPKSESMSTSDVGQLTSRLCEG